MQMAPGCFAEDLPRNFTVLVIYCSCRTALLQN